MRTLVIAVLLFTVGTFSEETLEWWQSGVIYQIYPRSFKDTNGNGYGDLKGIQEKMPYLKNLGVSAIWISPIYPSPGKDFGYDISDYEAIDPLFGTMEDFEDLLEMAHNNDIKVILDFVPNHSSDKHVWFQKSYNNDPTYRDYYRWFTGKAPNVPPNNWVQGFNGPAWTYNKLRDEWYLHQFLKEQPDLNYENPVVQQEMNDVLRFWLNKGVDGFRMDAVYTIYETGLADEPKLYPNCNASLNYCLNHIYTADQDGTYEVLSKFRQVLDEYSSQGEKRVMMTESYTKNWTAVQNYYKYRGQNVSDYPFNFMLIMDINKGSSAEDWAREINNWYSNTKDYGWANWVIGNHDQHRFATRIGAELVDAVNMIMLILKGTAVTYQGDELGMVDSFVRWDEAKDPQGIRNGEANFLSSSRDPNRGPFIWDSTSNAGFTNASKPWLPVESDYWMKNALIQQSNNRSHLNTYRRMLKLRQTYLWQFGKCNVTTINGSNILGVFRWAPDNPTIMTLVNFGNNQEWLNLQEERPSLPPSVYVYAVSDRLSYGFGDAIDTTQVVLPPKSAMTLISQPLDLPLRINATAWKEPKSFVDPTTFM